MSARASATRVAPERQPRESARPTLQPLPAARPAARASRWARLRRRLSPVSISAGLVVVALVAVVVGNMQLAAGQLRLSQLQAQVLAVQYAEAASEAHVTALASPAAIAHDVAGTGKVQPSEILQIPSVSLEARLGPPTFSYAPCCSLTPGR